MDYYLRTGERALGWNHHAEQKQNRYRYLGREHGWLIRSSVIAEAMNVARFVDLKLNHTLICPLEEKNLPPRDKADYDP